MLHVPPLVSTIAIGLVLAFAFGVLANRFKLPPLVGYLVAGIVIGPFTPGFVADQTLASELAEIGVILLMFGVGLHFSLEQLLSVRAIAVPGAIAQIACATLLGMALGHWLGWSLGAGLVFGLAQPELPRDALEVGLPAFPQEGGFPDVVDHLVRRQRLVAALHVTHRGAPSDSPSGT